ncbi:biotin transporter BioY [Bacillus xiapuensis]|uniref:biotin transporter BioY n=1 Tax=Bacillus xiapuensis TaxID=2014075 RepID=UPI000C23FF03|nr:biotin transporter BioY [Bacillus xiapuensis]
MKANEMVLCALFAALMAVGANASPFLTIGGVPITLQLFFAVLAGGLLGSRLGAWSMAAYLFIGLAGAPVFAQFKGGPASLLSPTFGFVISFIFVAFAAGLCLEKGGQKIMYVYAGLLSLLINYMLGTNWMYAAFTWWAEAPEGFSYLVAWSWMAAYLPLDIAVIILSLVILPKLRAVLKYRKMPPASYRKSSM